MASTRLTKSLKISYHRMVSSIAFYPALIAIGFLILSWLMLELDFSESGKYIKAHYSWVRLKDASTARTIVSTISGGIISLMVFSFSMVMILLNQAASQMSNRMLEGMIGNRFQQCVLGLYIGTIVYSLFLLSTIRDIESGIYVPALSIYLLLLITVSDVFVFIYFLHYVTQSAKFETIIDRVHKQTLKAIEGSAGHHQHPENIWSVPKLAPQYVYTTSSGYYQGFDRKQLLTFADQHDLIISIACAPGKFLLKGQAILIVYYNEKLVPKNLEELLVMVDFFPGQPVSLNPYYGFHQLTEVALKALSPGINDPETAVLSLNALADLFLVRLNLHSTPVLTDEHNKVRVLIKEQSFIELFKECIYPIWDYGKNDRYIQHAFNDIITQFIERSSNAEIKAFLVEVLVAVKSRINNNIIFK